VGNAAAFDVHEEEGLIALQSGNLLISAGGPGEHSPDSFSTSSMSPDAAAHTFDRVPKLPGNRDKGAAA
jgi:hypothetical protein